MSNKVLYIKNLKGQYFNVNNIECLWVKESYMLDGTYDIMLDIAGREEGAYLVRGLISKEVAQNLLDTVIHKLMESQAGSISWIIALEVLVNAGDTNVFKYGGEN